MNLKDIAAGVKKYRFSSICATLSLLLLITFLLRRGGVPDCLSLIGQKTAESSRLQTNVTNSTSLKEHVQKLININQLVSGRLIKAGDLAKNQQYFYKMEADSGAKLMDLRPLVSSTASKNLPKSHYSLVSYSCTFQGTYQQLIMFLRKLEGGEHFSRISIASVSLLNSGAEAAGSADPLLSVTLSIEFLGQS